MKSDSAHRARRAAIERLEDLERAGVTHLPRPARRAPAAQPPAVPHTATSEQGSTSATPVGRQAPAPPAGGASPGRSSGALVEKQAQATGEAAPTLEVLQQQVAGCTRCDELARTRTQTVFGVGNPAARLCFLGEAPGADEDRLGEPFVGRGGQLLNRIIEACRLSRDEVYILNMIKCRPPGNRNPLPQELSNCRGYLERQFDLIRPEFICCLGAVAAQNLLGTTISIGKLRGKLHDYRGAKVVCTYHPAFLLRSPSFKKEAWEDMKLLMREMGVQL